MLTDSFNAPVSGQATSGPTVDFSAIADDIANKRKLGIDNINLQDFVPTSSVSTSSVPFPGSEVANAQMSTVEPTEFQQLLADAPAGQPKSLFAKGVDKVKELGTSAYEGVTSGQFIGDVGRGVTTSLIMQEIAGDPEERFVSAGVSQKPISEAAQGNYVQSVSPSAMAATGMTRPLSFQELSQQTLYGTGSPNYLSQFYQPLAAPKAIG
jgi:hypothetical protein